MVIGEGEIHHGADLDLAADHHGPLLDLVHAQNARLRRVQDRRGHERTIDAAIGDGEGAALHLLQLQGAVAGALAEVRDGLLDLGEAHAVGVAHHGNHEALLGAHRNAQMVIVLVNEIRAVDLGVDGGDLLEGLGAGLHEEAHEAELGAMLLLEDVLVAGAQGHHFAHVDLVEGRQHGGGVLGVLEAARDGLAQLGHAHALFAHAVIGGRGNAGDDGRQRRGDGDHRASGHGGEHVALEHLAALARTGDVSGGQVVVSGDLRCGGRRRHGGSRLRGGRSSGSGGRLRRGCSHGSGGDRSGRRRSASAASGDLAEQGAGGDRLAILGEDFNEHAGRGRVDFDGDLVGLQLDQRLVRLHHIAGLLVPAADGGLGDGFAQGGHADFSSHASPPRQARPFDYC